MKPIEEVRKGDWVWSVAPETGDPELKQVEDVFVNETDEIVHVRYGDTEIDATPTHPFYVAEKGWVSAVNLRAGDRLQLLNGEYVVVEQVQHEILELPVKVYNFRVADNHTYYVGNDGDDAVLVHNANCGGKKITDLGKAGEKAAGIKKNTKSFRINDRMRIPDAIENGILKEVKNVKKLYKTRQLRDFYDLAHAKNWGMEIIVDVNTKLSKPLMDFINGNGIKLTRKKLR